MAFEIINLLTYLLTRSQTQQLYLDDLPRTSLCNDTSTVNVHEDPISSPEISQIVLSVIGWDVNQSISLSLW